MQEGRGAVSMDGSPVNSRWRDFEDSGGTGGKRTSGARGGERQEVGGRREEVEGFAGPCGGKEGWGGEREEER